MKRTSRSFRTVRFLMGSAIGLGLVASSAQADLATFTGSSGSLSASVTFQTSGSNLIVTLTNTSSADAMVPTDILSGVFFNLTGSPSLTSVSAVLNAGSTVINVAAANPAVLVPGGVDPGGVVGGEWAYASGISGPGGRSNGISSTGLGLFGNPNFPGNNLQDPLALDGIEYGITSAGDNPATGNGGIIDQVLIKNSVVFTLSGLPGGFSALSGVSSVLFQYGTSLTETSIPGIPPEGNPVPSPGASLLAMIGLGILGCKKGRVGPAVS
jgi:hypothetical protein